MFAPHQRTRFFPSAWVSCHLAEELDGLNAWKSHDGNQEQRTYSHHLSQPGTNTTPTKGNNKVNRCSKLTNMSDYWTISAKKKGPSLQMSTVEAPALGIHVIHAPMVFVGGFLTCQSVHLKLKQGCQSNT